MKEQNKKLEALTRAAEIQTNAARDILREAESRLARLNSSVEFIKRIAPLLPADWEISFSYGQVHIDKPRDDKKEKNSPVEFQLVCRDIERIMNVKGTRSFDDYGKGNGYLCASFNIYENEETSAEVFKAGLVVRVRFGSPSCKITYKEEKVAAHTRRVAIVPPECLGLGQEAEQ